MPVRTVQAFAPGLSLASTVVSTKPHTDRSYDGRNRMRMLIAPRYISNPYCMQTQALNKLHYIQLSGVFLCRNVRFFSLPANGRLKLRGGCGALPARADLVVRVSPAMSTLLTPSASSNVGRLSWTVQPNFGPNGYAS